MPNPFSDEVDYANDDIKKFRDELAQGNPDWDYASFLPIAKKKTPSSNPISGQYDWAIPQAARSLGANLMDLIQGTQTGQMTQQGFLSVPTVFGGQAAAPVENAFGVFGGLSAKTADWGALQKAMAMAETGETREAIHDATGWFQGPDKQWRFEIPDNRARINTSALIQNEYSPDTYGVPLFNKGVPLKMSEVLDHPELYEAYPELGKLNVHAQMMNYGGGSYGKDLQNNPGIWLGSNKLEGMRSTALHEQQHAIQDIEGFARGGNTAQFLPKDWEDTKSALTKDIKNFEDTNKVSFYDARYGMGKVERGETSIGPISERYINAYKNVPDKDKFMDLVKRSTAQDDMERQAYIKYKNLAGEAEARNVETRASDLEKQELYPWKTFDVPEENQMVNYKAGQQGSQANPLVRPSWMNAHQMQDFWDRENETLTTQGLQQADRRILQRQGRGSALLDQLDMLINKEKKK